MIKVSQRWLQHLWLKGVNQKTSLKSSFYSINLHKCIKIIHNLTMDLIGLQKSY